MLKAGIIALTAFCRRKYDTYLTRTECFSRFLLRISWHVETHLVMNRATNFNI
jgi:hypothetical protein